MKRISLLLASALFLAFCGAGCVTSTLKYTPADPGAKSSKGSPVSYVVEGMNSGVYLFYYIPLWTGNPRSPNQRDYDLFRHRIDDKAIYRMFDVAAHRMHSARYEDAVVTYRSSGIWTLWIVWKRSVHGRALLVSEKAKRRRHRRNKL